MKKINGTSFLLLSFLLSVILSGCDISVSTNDSPSRPENVPTNAQWVGGADGGVFVSIAKNQNKSFQLQVFHDDGEVWYEGAAQLKPENAVLHLPATDDELEGWDGTTLYLSNQRQLVTQSAP